MINQFIQSNKETSLLGFFGPERTHKKTLWLRSISLYFRKIKADVESYFQKQQGAQDPQEADYAVLQLKYLCVDNQLRVNEVNLSQRNYRKQLDYMNQFIEDMQKPSLIKQKLLPDLKIFFLELLELQGKEEAPQSQVRFPFIINFPARTLASFVTLCSPRAEHVEF